MIHPLCLVYAELELRARVQAGRIRILDILRLDATRDHWRQHKTTAPSRAFVCIVQENLAKRGKPRWDAPSAIVTVANCNCTVYATCPLALAMAFASRVGCTAMIVARADKATMRAALKRWIDDLRQWSKIAKKKLKKKH